MAPEGFAPEKIINKLREAEILLSLGEAVTVISKKLVADLSLDNAILKEVARGNF